MLFPKKITALAVGIMAVVAAASNAQGPAATSPTPETLFVQDVTLEWIEKSDVAALREGVIESIELKQGMKAIKGKPIGRLHQELAELTVAKALLTSEAEATIRKAQAQRQLAIEVLARSKQLNRKNPGSVSIEEIRKSEAEIQVADEMTNEAIEKQALDKADLKLAKQALDEHTILSPIDGLVIERLKEPGEGVRANEALVRIGNLDRLRGWAYIPLPFIYRVKEGQIVDLQVRLGGDPVEQRKFRGKITFVDPQVQVFGENAVRVYAEFENPDHMLRPGSKAVMTVYFGSEAGAANASPTVGSRTTGGVGR